MQADDFSSQIANASKIIERFGGIRPMAKKLRVPVTTVQGWKNRDAIPYSRKTDLIEAADIYRIDLSDFDWAAINDNAAPSAAKSDVQTPAANAAATTAAASAPALERKPTSPTQQSVRELEGIDLARVRRTSFYTSMLTSLGLTALVGGAAAALFMGSGNSVKQWLAGGDDTRLAAVEQRVQALENTPQTGLVTDLASRLGALMGWLGYDDTNGNEGTPIRTFLDRLSAVEEKLGNAGLTGQTADGLGAQMQGLTATATGNADAQMLFSALKTRLDGVEAALQSGQNVQQGLNATLGNITTKDATAAGLLLALVQFREATQRQTNIEADLALVQQLVAPQDPALAESVAKLAPYAQNGVLSPVALKQLLQDVAGDVVLTAAYGSDMSVVDKIKARLQAFFSLNKNGEAVLGSNNTQQKALDEARTQLDSGNVKGAIATLKALDATAQKPLEPFYTQAEATATAQDINTALVKLVLSVLNTRPAQQQAVPAATMPQPQAPTAEQPAAQEAPAPATATTPQAETPTAPAATTAN